MEPPAPRAHAPVKSLRRKTLLLVALTTLGLVVALYLPLRALLLASFERLEAETALSNLDRGENAIAEDLARLEATCRDYAVWDDTFAFLDGRAPDYPALNFVDETFAHNDLGLVALVDARGEVAFVKGYDLVRESERAPPETASWLDPLCPRGSDERRRCGETAGLLETPDGPFLAAIHPVLPSNGTGPARGALVMGRPLDDARIARLGDALDLMLSVSPRASDPSAPALDATHRTGARALDEERIAAFGLQSDVRGEPYLIVRVEMPRDIYARGLLGTRTLAVAVALAGIVFGVLIVLLLDRFVLRRVARLSTDVRRVSESADPTHRVAVEGDDELAGLASGINGMLGDLASAREVIRSALGRYVSEDVARAVLSRPEGAQLGGETREVTILFSDIRGYSTITERMAPTDVVDILNEHFGAMSELVEAEGGCVIEFLGDAILAVFGAPVDLSDHAERAVRAACAMQARSAELNRAWEESGRALLWKERGVPSLGSRIGIHAGRVVAGNLGSRSRMKYAVIGDAVNTAARVEGLNDVIGTDLLLTAEVRAALGPELAEATEDRGEHAVKGRERPVRVYTVPPSRYASVLEAT